MKNPRQFVSNYPFSLVCIALIWYLSVWFTPPVTPLNDVAFIDKWTHFAMYGGTCSVVWLEYLRCHQALDARKLLLYACLAPVAMGGVIELVQAFLTTNRSGEWLDFWADTFGVCLGTVFGLVCHRLRRAR